MKKENLSFCTLDQNKISNNEIKRFLVRESKGTTAYNIRSCKKLSEAYESFLSFRGFVDIFVELKDNRIIQLTHNYPDNLTNIKKYYKIIKQYRNGDFGDKSLNMTQILKAGGSPNLFKEMSISEIQTLINCSSGSARNMFVSIKKQKSKTLEEMKKNSPLYPINYGEISHILISWHDAKNKNLCFDEMMFDDIIEALEFWYSNRYNPKRSDDYVNISVTVAGVGFLEIGDGFKERSNS